MSEDGPASMATPSLHQTAPIPRSAVVHHAALADKGINFEPIGFDEARRQDRWHVDTRRRIVGREPPGPPIEGGAFDVARRAMLRYEFADPERIRAAFDPTTPFDGRNMLLVGRFLFLRFVMGVRVGGVVDDEETRGERRLRVFSWYYRTLDGHLEQGQMDYRLQKDQTSGEVEASIAAYSRPSERRNPLVRLGLTVVGRRLQLDFYDDCLRRLQRIVAERTASDRERPA